MEAVDLAERTMEFSLRIIKLVQSLPKTIEGRNIADQVMRSGTSIGANYREARAGRSHAEFTSKLCICRGEADETVYWLDMLIRSGIVPKARLASLLEEAEELAAILAAAVKTAFSSKK